jgi:pilus assembly protein FimV
MMETVTEPVEEVVEETVAVTETAPVAEKVEPAPAAVTQPKAEPKPEPVAKKAPPRSKPQQEEEKGFFASIVDTLTGSLMGMIGGIVLIVLVIVGLVVMMRRRRSMSEFEDSIISGTAVLDISTAESAQPTETQSETSFLSDFVPGMANMQADEVDPLAEAEVYMAYGRDEQAEDVLKKAITATPDRHELKIKLLEIYKTRNDVTSFETLAEELYSGGDATPAEIWNQAAEMGRELNPANPLYAEGGAPGADEDVAGIYDNKGKKDQKLEDLLGTGQEHTEEIDVTEEVDVTEDVPSPEEDVLDLGDLDLDEATTDKEQSSLDFNMDGIDLNLGEDESTSGEAKHDDTLEFADIGDLTLSDVEPDMADEEAPVEEWDECTTKLDLARAYIEMGDSDSASSILKEVTVEGNDSQKQEAQEMLSQLNG